MRPELGALPHTAHPSSLATGALAISGADLQPCQHPIMLSWFGSFDLALILLLATKLYRLSAKNKVVSGDFIEDSTTGNNAKNTRALYEGQITKNKSTTRTSTIHAQSQAATVTMNAGTDAQESGSDQTNF
ncbi:hypothetical protein T08_3040 [Trichinella sp. T8]|nr:hypothetical protein T08_3040 [Trichinella sp. T8]